MDNYRRCFLDRGRQAAINNIYAWMDFAVVSYRTAEKGKPYQQIAGKLLGPEQRVVEGITRKNLGGHNGGHGKTEPKKQPFNPVIDFVTEAFKSIHFFCLFGGV